MEGLVLDVLLSLSGLGRPDDSDTSMFAVLCGTGTGTVSAITFSEGDRETRVTRVRVRVRGTHLRCDMLGTAVRLGGGRAFREDEDEDSMGGVGNNDGLL